MVDNKIIGFVGCDKHEIMLYLSRILYHLNKKVLLVDFSESEALSISIPVPETIQEKGNYMDYRGIDFIKGPYYSSVKDNEYDYTLIDFGFNQEVLSAFSCDKVIYVTDLQLHNVRRIKVSNLIDSSSRYIIIKDVFPCKVKPEFLLELLDPNAIQDHVYVLPQDALDIKYKISSQYSQTFYFHKLSKTMKSFLKDMIKQIDGSLDYERIKLAYKRAERGK